jgi:hypothetical protein
MKARNNMSTVGSVNQAGSMHGKSIVSRRIFYSVYFWECHCTLSKTSALYWVLHIFISWTTSALLVEFFEIYPHHSSKYHKPHLNSQYSYRLDDRGVGVRVLVRSLIFTSSYRPDRLSGPPNLQSNGKRGPLPQRKRAQALKLTTHVQLVPRRRKRGSIGPLPHKSLWRSVHFLKRMDNFTVYPRKCW